MITHAFPIYFGGHSTDQWTANSLQVHYTDRICVMAEPDGQGRYIAKSTEDPFLAAEINQCKFSLNHVYFHIYSSIYEAITRLQEDGKDIYAFPQYFSGDFSPLAVGEILRVLLDNWGISWVNALHLISRCQFHSAQAPWRVSNAQISAVQPRTAQLMEILEKSFSHDLAVIQCVEQLLSRLIVHDSASEDYRCPIGSVPTEGQLQLRLFDGAGLVKHAEVIFTGDSCHREVPMDHSLSCSVDLPQKPVALRYRFRLTLINNQTCWLGEALGKETSCVALHDLGGFRLTVYQKGFDTPSWFRRSIMYQIFPDRFAGDDSSTAMDGMAYHRSMGRPIDYAPSWDQPVKWQPGPNERHYTPNDFYGGTFRGIESKLPYLKELGISVVYLNPIVESCSNHRYDTANYLVPDPILGTMDDFDHLVAAGKALGIRILLDGVFSHTGADSVYFNRSGCYPTTGAYQSKDSPYYPWFKFYEYPQKYRAWWGFDSLPEVEETNPQWQDFIITGQNSVVRNWLRHGTCGWRLDVADELPDEVLELIRQATKEEGEDLVVLGEVWEDAIEKESYGHKRTYALGNALDTTMNYPFRDAVYRYLAGHADAHSLAEFLLSQRLHYPKPMYYSLMNLLSSHDIPRIRTMLAIAPEVMPSERTDQVARTISAREDQKGAQLQKLAAALAFAIPGVPSVYYGDETGMNGFRDPFNRAPFHTGAIPLVDWYTTLGRLRNETPALSTGSIGVYAPNDEVVMVLRSVAGGVDALGEPAENGTFLLMVNRSSQPSTVQAHLPSSFQGFTTMERSTLESMEFTQGLCALTGHQIPVEHHRIQTELPPVSVRLYQLN